MRSTQLAIVALQAEKIRLQRKFRRLIYRMAMGAFAAIFVVLAFIFLHLAGYVALCRNLPPHWAALIVAGVDTVLAIILVLMAAKKLPDPVEADAVGLRNDAILKLRNTVALTTALRPLMGVIGRKTALGIGLTAVLTHFFSRR